MICLGIETTAHTFGISIVTSEKKVLSNIRKSFTTKKGGMIPSEVADHHTKYSKEVIEKALKEAKKTIKDINLISFSQGPGIGHTLKIGAVLARTLSLKHKIPLVGVNHCIAHLEIANLLFESKNPLLLYASGANTQIISYEGKRYRIFGETLDIGIGNFLDSCARAMDLGFPGGPKIYELALKGKKFIELPYTIKGMDISFGGLLTNIKQKLKDYKKEDLCYSIQETVFAMLIEISERALAHTGKKELILGGGVACNIRLQEMAKKMCQERNTKIYIPENEFLMDNAAMIAWLGIISKRTTPIEKTKIHPYERTDEVEVNWK